jgi:threonylcarbamoyladenosine tRNA methylthiotransferase MtaB
MANAACVQVVSFGCKVNQVEGENLASTLRDLGWADAPYEDAADLVIVNTCTVTGEAARQSRQRVRRALRCGARVIVTGCAAHPAAEDASLRNLAGLLLVEPDKDRVARFLEECGMRSAECRVRNEAAGKAETAPPPGRRLLPAAHGLSLAVHSSLRTPRSALDRSRALLKIQDGCPASCAYCIVPRVRPMVRSAPPEAGLEQVANLVAAGFREIVLCGIHLGLYGADVEPPLSLADLLEQMLEVPGLGRLRLSSIEPMEVSDRLLGLMAAEPERLCPHLHIPLQSGDDGVLARMGRLYSTVDFLSVVERIRRAVPQPAITTDVLVGFPGETGEAFAETLRVCREAAFSRLHVFPFSKRPGTRAAAMKPDVPKAVIQDRRRRAAGLGESLAQAYRASLVGRTAQVVIEKMLPDGGAEGLSERYVRVRLRGPLPAGAARRSIVPVETSGIEGDALSGQVGPV